MLTAGADQSRGHPQAAAGDEGRHTIGSTARPAKDRERFGRGRGRNWTGLWQGLVPVFARTYTPARWHALPEHCFRCTRGASSSTRHKQRLGSHAQSTRVHAHSHWHQEGPENHDHHGEAQGVVGVVHQDGHHTSCAGTRVAGSGRCSAGGPGQAVQRVHMPWPRTALRIAEDTEAVGGKTSGTSDQHCPQRALKRGPEEESTSLKS